MFVLISCFLSYKYLTLDVVSNCLQTRIVLAFIPPQYSRQHEWLLQGIYFFYLVHFLKGCDDFSTLQFVLMSFFYNEIIVHSVSSSTGYRRGELCSLSLSAQTETHFLFFLALGNCFHKM